jgi:hypothetical protein
MTQIVVAVIGAIATVLTAWITSYQAHKPGKRNPAGPPVRDSFGRVLAIVATGIGLTSLTIGLLQVATAPSIKDVAAEIRPEVTKTISTKRGVVIPHGAVLAFDALECPDGWSLFDRAAGRMIVGVGQGKMLTERNLRQTGGREQVTLGLEELPEHRHSMGVGTSDTTAMTPVQPRLVHLLPDQYNKNGVPFTGAEGHSRPFDIMPPWIALTLCRKE